MTPISKPSFSRRGLSLIEVMISLAICAMLLVAVATAFTASSAAITQNDQFFRATQSARVSMGQMLNAIRRCQTCDVPSAGRVNLITFDDHDCSYVFDSATGRLKLVTNDVTTDPDYVLARNVTNITFAADYAPDPSTQVNRVVRVTISITVKVGNNQVLLSNSAVPRRAIVY